jgi:chromosome segregation ATPase
MNGWWKFLAVTGLALMVGHGSSLAAQDEGGDVSMAELRAEVSEAMEAVKSYSAEQRDEALARADEALTELDTAIERYDAKLREDWAQMSEAAREKATTAMRELRETRNDMAEWYGALRHSADSAWDDIKSGFAAAYDELQAAWQDADDASGSP